MARYWWGGRKPEPLTAAATVIDTPPPKGIQWGGTAPQTEAWAFHRAIPELHRAASDMGEAFSRAVMIVVDVDPTSGELGTVATDDTAAGALGVALFGGRTGQAQAQRAMGQNLTVAGDLYVWMVDPRQANGGPTWRVLSVSDVQSMGSAIRIRQPDMTWQTYRKDQGQLMFRLHQPDPENGALADSPTLSSLTVLRELNGLSAQVWATIQSRLAAAGVWLLPDSATLPPLLDENGNIIDQSPQSRWGELIQTAMMAQIANPGDPSAIVPIVAMIPEEALDKIKEPIRFVQDVIAEIQPMREAAMRRLAVGFDQPPERLLGQGGMNHWGAWANNEEFVKGPLSSLLALPAAALTEKYLHPMLTAMGKNPELFAIAYDVGALLPTVEVANAQQAFDAGVLSERVYLETLGFDYDRDKATDDERARRFISHMLERGNFNSIAEVWMALRTLYPGLNLPDTVPDLPSQPTQPVTDRPAIEAPSTTDTHQPPSRPVAPSEAPQ